MAKELVHAGTISESAYAALVNTAIGGTSQVRIYADSIDKDTIADATASIAVLPMVAPWVQSGSLLTAPAITSDTTALAGTAKYGAVFNGSTLVFKFNVGLSGVTPSVVLSSTVFEANDTVSLISLTYDANLDVALS